MAVCSAAADRNVQAGAERPTSQLHIPHIPSSLRSPRRSKSHHSRRSRRILHSRRTHHNRHSRHNRGLRNHHNLCTHLRRSHRHSRL